LIYRTKTDTISSHRFFILSRVNALRGCVHWEPVSGRSRSSSWMRLIGSMPSWAVQ